MNITITVINIHHISNIGSFNVGKTIVCRNTATSVFETPPLPKDDEVKSELTPTTETQDGEGDG